MRLVSAEWLELSSTRVLDACRSCRCHRPRVQASAMQVRRFKIMFVFALHRCIIETIVLEKVRGICDSTREDDS